MIAQLTGTIADSGLDEVTIDVAGVGYRVLVAPALAGELTPGTELTLHTSLVVREDSQTLYGFRDRDERVVFEKLQSVSGIGPRIALAALAVLTPDDLRRAVRGGDLATLQRIPGVGKKSAQRMALDLGDKLGLPAALPGTEGADGSAVSAGGEAVLGGPTDVETEVKAALVQLGWTEAVAEKTVQSLSEYSAGMDASTLLRSALVKLGGQRGR